jgi:uncharacterized membrane protein SpoIIM required for sporulation
MSRDGRLRTISMTPAEVRLLTRVLSAFEHRTFRGRLRRHAALPAAVFLAAFAASLHLGDGAGTTDGTAALEVIAGATMTPWQIFANNAGVLLAIFVGGVLTFTVGAVFVLVKNAVHFGWGVSLLAEAYGTTVAFAALLPHGVLETAAFLVVAAASMRVSVLVAWSRVVPGSVWRRDLLWDVAALVAVAVALLALAAVVETTLTPAVVERVAQR